jgi:hypothetical protein
MYKMLNLMLIFQEDELRGALISDDIRVISGGPSSDTEILGSCV